MPSPFPGMDPYLEHPFQWEDFHDSFVIEMRKALVPQVSPKYRAQIKEMIFLEADMGDGSRGRRVGAPDATVVVEANATGRAPAARGGAGVLEAPARLLLPEPEVVERHPYIEVLDREGREVVTAIELLSRSNKDPGADRFRYEAKRQELLRSGANFVEIDLLRTRPRVIPDSGSPPFEYYVLVSRFEERPEAGFWPLRIRERLPRVPVPLRLPDADAVLDLQSVLDTVYDAAAYGAYVYEREVDPPMQGEDADWARDVVASQK